MNTTPLMTTVFMSLVTSTASASTQELALTGEQPLAAESTLLVALGASCGAEIVSSTESPTATRHELELCDVIVDLERGSFSVHTAADPVSSDTRIAQAALSKRGTADVAMLEALGFDAKEMDELNTVE